MITEATMTFYIHHGREIIKKSVNANASENAVQHFWMWEGKLMQEILK